MNEAERKAQIRRYWEQTGADQDASHEIYHDAAVLEFPQSGERFEGVANFKEWRGQYPAGVALEMRNLRGQGDLWVVEGAISYDGGPWQPAVNILEFRGDKVARRRSTSPSRGTRRSGVPVGGRRRSARVSPGPRPRGPRHAPGTAEGR